MLRAFSSESLQTSVLSMPKSALQKSRGILLLNAFRNEMYFRVRHFLYFYNSIPSSPNRILKKTKLSTFKNKDLGSLRTLFSDFSPTLYYKIK